MDLQGCSRCEAAYTFAIRWFPRMREMVASDFFAVSGVRLEMLLCLCVVTCRKLLMLFFAVFIFFFRRNMKFPINIAVVSFEA